MLSLYYTTKMACLAILIFPSNQISFTIKLMYRAFSYQTPLKKYQHIKGSISGTSTKNEVEKSDVKKAEYFYYYSSLDWWVKDKAAKSKHYVNFNPCRN